MPDVNSDLFKQLAGMAFAPVSSSHTTSDFDIAKQILLNSSVDSSRVWKFNNAPLPTDKGKKQGGPSAFSRVIDIIQRPEYASTAYLKSFSHELGKGNLYSLNPVKAAWKGLTGEDKALPSKAISDMGAMPSNGIGKFAVGLTADIAGDPLTYVGPGLVKGIIKGVKELTSAEKTAAVIAKTAEEAPKTGATHYITVPGKADKVVKTEESVRKRSAFQQYGPLTIGNEDVVSHVIKALEDAPAVSTALDQTVKTAGVAEHALSPMQAALVTDDAVKEGKTVLKATEASSAAVTTFSKTMGDVLYQNRGTPQNVILKNSDAIKMRMLPKGTRTAKGRFAKNPWLKARPVSTAIDHSEALTNIRNHMVSVSPSGQDSWRYIQLSHTLQRFTEGASIETTMADVRNRLFPFKDVKPATYKYIESQLKAARMPKSVATLMNPIIPGKTATQVSNALVNASDAKHAAQVASTFPKVVEATTRALNGALEEPIRVLKPGETISEKGVTHGIMSRVATWWGNKDVRPMVLDAKTSALASAGARMDALANLFKPFNDEQLLQAWDVATKIRPRDITNPDVVNLADQLTGSMENWFKSSAIPEKAAQGNSVAMRAGFTLDEMNAALKRYNIDFKFTDSATAAVKGGTRTRDFSQGVDWLDSWEGHIPETAQDLRKAIFGIQTAAEQLSKEHAFLDDAASRFGSTVRKKGWVAIKNSRLEGWYFPPDMADQMSIALKNYHDMYIPSSDIAKFIASSVSSWKSGVTKYNPRHHIANITGDSFLAWMAGVNNPLVFRKAGQVLMSQRGHYKDIASVEDLVKPGAIADAMTKPGKVIIKNKSGLAFTADQIYIAAHNYGLLQKVSAIEDLMPNNVLSKFKPLGGKLSHATSVFSETREHYVKLAHFIDILGKSKGKNFTEIYENAAHTVRKWHPDGLDLTKEEQALRTYGIPFYSWLRKSTPLIIEGAVMNPKKAFAIPQHFQYNTQMGLGITPSSSSDPFPADQMFPKWIQESGMGPMGLTGAPGLSGWLASQSRQGIDKDTGKSIGGYTIAGPSLPTNDLFEQFGGFNPEGIARGLAGSVNPLFRVPAEVAFQQRVYSGVPINDWSDYATEQIPMASQASRITNVTPFGNSERATNEGNFNKEGLYNWLFNAGITGTGPYIKSAEFEDIPRQAEQNKKYRDFAAKIGSPLNSKGKIPDWIKQLYNQQGANK